MPIQQRDVEASKVFLTLNIGRIFSSSESILPTEARLTNLSRRVSEVLEVS